MLSVRDKGLIIQILAYCDRIKQKIENIGLDEFKKDIDTRDIICFNVFQIGELAKGLSNEFVSQHNEVYWKGIKGMRDKVAHGYGTIDLDQIWTAASQEVKPLRKYCELILEEDK